MRIKEGFVIREIAGSIVVVPTGDLLKEYRGMLTLNEAGKFIWELLEQERTLEEISAKLAEKYQIDKEKATANTEAFLDTLKAKKILLEN